MQYGPMSDDPWPIPNHQTRSRGECGSFDPPARSLRKGVIRSLPQAGPGGADCTMIAGDARPRPE